MNIFIAKDPQMHQSIADWVATRIAHVDAFEKMTTIGVTSDAGVPMGAVVYHDYRDADIQMSCAADNANWLSKSVLSAIFAYPFTQLNCARVTALTPSRNIHTRKFLERLGFVQEGLMRQGFIDDDCVIYGMLRTECKWIEGEYCGKK